MLSINTVVQNMNPCHWTPQTKSTLLKVGLTAVAATVAIIATNLMNTPTNNPEEISVEQQQRYIEMCMIMRYDMRGQCQATLGSLVNGIVALATKLDYHNCTQTCTTVLSHVHCRALC